MTCPRRPWVKPHPFTAALFWARSTPAANGCRLWTGTISESGYGTGPGKGHRVAHRVAFEMENGPIPDGLVVCHFCDVRHCVQPSHLFLSTDLGNAADWELKRCPNLDWRAESTRGLLARENRIAERRQHDLVVILAALLAAEPTTIAA